MRPSSLRAAMIAAALMNMGTAFQPVPTFRRDRLPAGYNPLATLATFESARPRPWRTGGRHTNRNIRRARALAAGRKSLVAESRRYSRDMARLERLNEAVRQRMMGRFA